MSKLKELIDMEATKVSFSAKDVMALREKTGLPMMDCKAALTEAGGDTAKAEEILRAKRKGRMDTRTERATAEGRIGIAIAGADAVIVEIRTESDFTARNDQFIAMVNDVTKAALALPPGPITANAAMTKRIDDVRLKSDENVNFARGERLRAGAGGAFGSYLHHDGKRGALVQIEGGPIDPDTLNGIATHIVGFSPTPIGISAADVPKATVERIRADAIAEAKESGKPDQIAQKMAEGRVGKYLKENTLLDQPYVKDPAGKQTIKELLKGATVKKFLRYTVGG